MIRYLPVRVVTALLAHCSQTLSRPVYHKAGGVWQVLHPVMHFVRAVEDLPPLNKIFLVGIWIETVIWVFNCVLYASAVWVILRGKHKENAHSRVLGIVATILFTFGTLHMATSLRQLLEAFINIPPGAPTTYSITYWADQTIPPAIIKNVVYVLTDGLQSMFLLWRLYVVWDGNRKLCLFLFCIDVVHLGCGLAAIALESKPGADIHNAAEEAIGLVGWSLNIAVNLGFTTLVVFRLWHMGNRQSRESGTRLLSSSDTGRNVAPSTARVPIPSPHRSGVGCDIHIEHHLTPHLGLGGLQTRVHCTGPFHSNRRKVSRDLSRYSLTSSVQVMTPLMITVRVGLGLTHGVPAVLTASYARAADVGLAHLYRPSPGPVQIMTVHDVVVDGDETSGSGKIAIHNFKGSRSWCDEGMKIGSNT